MAGLTGFPSGERGAFSRRRGFVAEGALQIQFGVALVGERFGPRQYGERRKPEKYGCSQYLLLIHLATQSKNFLALLA